MAESSTTTTDTPETSSEVAPTAAEIAKEAIPNDEVPATPPRRKVYESTLIPERRRRRAPRWVVLLVVVVVLGGAAFFAFGNRGQRFVPTAGKVVYAASDTPGGNSRLWISGIDGSGAHPISGATSNDESPSFSADGNRVAYAALGVGGDRQIFVVDADGKNPQQVTTTSGSKSDPAFAPQSNNLLAYTSGGVLFDLDLSANASDRLLPPDDSRGGGNKDADADQTQSTTAVQQFAWAPGAKKPEDQALAASMSSQVGRDAGQILAVMPSIDKDPITTTASGSDSGQQIPLAFGENLTVGWSPDGGLLAVAVMGAPIMRPPGTPVPPNMPDRESTILMFTSSGEITQHEVIPVQAFIQKGSKVLYGPEHPLFSPDDSDIIFEVWSEPDLLSRQCIGLYKVAVGGGSMPQPVAVGDAEKAQFSQDGQSLLYLLRRPDGGHDLMELSMSDPTKSTPKRISDGRVDVTDFTISPQKG